jgi:ribonucleoside-diphosphate reductase alpha chain
MGLKCVAIYRDGSKRSQPLNTSRTTEDAEDTEEDVIAKFDARIKELEAERVHLQKQAAEPLRKKLPDTRAALNHKFSVADHEGYLTVGLFEDGQPGEMFITMAKEGSTIGGLMDSVAALTSMALQYGVPLEVLVKKFSHQRFEPSGFTKNPDIRQASSIMDYVFRWLGMQFIPGYREAHLPTSPQQEFAIPGLAEEEAKRINRSVPELPIATDTELIAKSTVIDPASRDSGEDLQEALKSFMKDAPPCPKCGHIAVRNGACFKCLNCGESLGCS